MRPCVCRRAIACIERCLHLKPYHAEVHLCAAALHYFARNYERSRRHLNAVLEALGHKLLPRHQGRPPKRLSDLSPQPGPEHRTWGDPFGGGYLGSLSAGDSDEEWQIRGRKGLWSKRVPPPVRPESSPWQVFVAGGGVQRDLLHGVGKGCLTLETRKAIAAASASHATARRWRITERQRILDAEKRSLTLLRRPVWPAARGAGSEGTSGGKSKSGAPQEEAGRLLHHRPPPPRIRMTNHAPLQLDKSLFDKDVIADVRLLRHKMDLLCLAGSPHW
jgi:hypothetical protein